MIDQPTFAKMAPAIVHTPGLFTSRPKVMAEKLVTVLHTMGDTVFTFSGPQLGTAEMRVLQGLVSLGQVHSLRPTASKDGTDSAGKHELLRHHASAEATTNQLAQVIGYRVDSGSAHATIHKALQRLGSVQVSLHKAGSPGADELSAGNLIHELQQVRTRTIEVGLSPILAAALYARKGGYLRTELAETRQLKSDPARLLHHRLHWINAGCTGDVYLSTLNGYVWSAEPVSSSTQRSRRQTLREALGELQSAGWSVTPEMRRDGLLLHIGRPYSPGFHAQIRKPQFPTPDAK